MQPKNRVVECVGESWKGPIPGVRMRCGAANEAGSTLVWPTRTWDFSTLARTGTLSLTVCVPGLARREPVLWLGRNPGHTRANHDEPWRADGTHAAHTPRIVPTSKSIDMIRASALSQPVRSSPSRIPGLPTRYLHITRGEKGQRHDRAPAHRGAAAPLPPASYPHPSSQSGGGHQTASEQQPKRGGGRRARHRGGAHILGMRHTHILGG